MALRPALEIWFYDQDQVRGQDQEKADGVITENASKAFNGRSCIDHKLAADIQMVEGGAPWHRLPFCPYAQVEVTEKNIDRRIQKGFKASNQSPEVSPWACDRRSTKNAILNPWARILKLTIVKKKVRVKVMSPLPTGIARQLRQEANQWFLNDVSKLYRFEFN